MPLILLSIPGLREKDVAAMPQLREMTADGPDRQPRAQLSLRDLPGAGQHDHRPAARGARRGGQRLLLARQAAGRDVDLAQRLHRAAADLGPPFAREGRRPRPSGSPCTAWAAEADFICTPAPIHNPDGSESLWCYTRPTELYGELRDELGHFPLQHFWGPLANIRSTAWIADSAAIAARRWQPDFFWIYLPHLDYAAQKPGPDSPARRPPSASWTACWAGSRPWTTPTATAAVARGRRIRHHAGRSRRVSQPRAPRGRAAGGPRGGRRRASRLGGQPGLGPGRSSVLTRFRRRRRCARWSARVADLFRGQPGIAEVLVGDRARPLRLRPRPQRRGDPDLHAQQLAGLLLLAGRRPGSRLRPHGRHPPQAGLRPGGVARRPGHAEHSAGRHARPRLARRPGRRSRRSRRSCWPPSRSCPTARPSPTPTCSGS